MNHTFGKSPRVVLALSGVLCLGYLSGCSEPTANSQWEIDHPVPSRGQNIQHGNELTAQAQAAETRQDYQTALARYGELQSLPDYARPRDLDQRIRMVKSKSVVFPATQPA